MFLRLFLKDSLCIALCGLVLLISGCGGESVKSEGPEAPEVDASLKKEEPEYPEISESGPYPKAVVPVKMHEFGTMALGETGKHTFTISNQGEADLVIKAGATTCKCTLSEVDKKVLKVGESTEITLSWTPKADQEEFVQTAAILTNDPNYKDIRLRVRGKVVPILKFEPGMSWTLGELKRDEPTEFHGSVGSQVKDDLKIEKLESSDKKMKVESVPFTKEELKKFKMKSGYYIKGQVEPANKVGQFDAHIDIKFNIKENSEMKLKVHGHRTGPVKIVGPGWNSDKNVVYLNEFSAEKGKTLKLAMFIDKKDKDEIKVKDLEAQPDYVQFTMKRNDSFKVEGREQYILTFKIPPGIAPDAKDHEDKAWLKFTTNHKLLEEVTFNLIYQAY